MKCKVCGNELIPGAKFCGNCGTKIEYENDSVEYTNDILQSTESESTNDEQKSSAKNTYSKKVKTSKKVIEKWKALDIIGKIIVIYIPIAIVLFIVSVSMESFVPAIISIITILVLIASILIHKSKIKVKNNNLIKIFAIAIAGLMVIDIVSCPVSVELMKKAPTYTPYSSKECKGKNFFDVQYDFIDAGFTNIKGKQIADLDISDEDKKDTIETIKIDNKSNFKANEKFKRNSKIVIEYHTIKKVGVPFSSKDAEIMAAEKVIELLTQKGFVNISSSEIYDLDPNETNVAFKTEVLIDGWSLFDKGEKIPLDAEIEVVTHYPFEAFNVKLHLDFVENIIFSRYDVEFEIDGKTDTLTHGVDNDYEYQLKPGNYKLNFTNVEDSTVKGSINLKVEGDMEVTYRIYCHYDKISITKVSPNGEEETGELEEIEEETTSKSSKKTNASFHSSGDYDIAKEGNSGVFAYAIQNANYVYYIIDFDEGYVYRFLECEDDTCMKAQIDSGDLNSRVNVFYHAGNDVWLEGIYFKYKNIPHTAELQDGNGWTYKLGGMDVEDALKLRDTKTIIEY